MLIAIKTFLNTVTIVITLMILLMNELPPNVKLIRVILYFALESETFILLYKFVEWFS